VERGRSVQVIDPTVDGVHGSLIPTTSSLGEPSPYACQEAPYPRRNLEVVYAVHGITCDFLRVTSLIDSPELRLLRVDELTDS